MPLVLVVFSDAGVNFDDQYTASCGGGISSCWIALAASVCNKTIPVYTVSVYDVTVLFINLAIWSKKLHRQLVTAMCLLKIMLHVHTVPVASLMKRACMHCHDI